ncbi:DUF1015 domain-containing protein [Planctomycetaceae bacterium SH139]
MPQISAFRGIRYNLGRVGSLAKVVAPPYDVISPAQQEALYDRHEANVVRLILNRAQPSDGESERYGRAAQLLKRWQAEGLLQTEGDPALYVYHQEFEWEGERHHRRSVICRLRLEPFGTGNIFPHEQTHPKAKADRLQLLNACRTNLSPVFGLFPDEQQHVTQTLNAAIAGVAGLACQDDLGVQHTVWPVTNVNVITEVVAAASESPLFIADGHHRYETACDYRDQLEQAQGPLPAEHPANFIMAALVSMYDPGLQVLPTHRLLRGTPELTTEQLIARLGDHFMCEPCAAGADGARLAWQRMVEEDDQEMLALYVKPSDQWLLCQASELAIERLRILEPDHSDEWRGLGVSLLHRLVIDDLLQADGHPKPTYVHAIEEVIDGLNGRGARSEEEGRGDYSMAALVQPASVSQVEAISMHGERMPAKSTYFYPKLLSGLVFNPLY